MKFVCTYKIKIYPVQTFEDGFRCAGCFLPLRKSPAVPHFGIFVLCQVA